MVKVFDSPEVLEAAGFKLYPPVTLKDTELFNTYMNRIKRLVEENAYIQQRPPRQYQAEYAAIMACRYQNFPIWDMGVGKSFLACLLIHLWYGDALKLNTKSRGEKFPDSKHWLGTAPLRPGAIQIVAPRHTLKLTWLDKELKKSGLAQYAEIIYSEEDILKSTKPIWLYSYDFLNRQTQAGKEMAKYNKTEKDEELKKGMRKQGKKTYFLGRTISRLIARKFPPKFLIADEIHRLRSGTDRTRCFKQVSRKAARKLGMTGTPMDGWVEHISTILGITYGIESKAFPFTEELFTKRFTRTKVVNQDWATGEEGQVAKERQVPGVNPAQLPEFYRSTRHLMHRLMIRDPEVNGQVEFPPVTLHECFLPMTPNHYRYYNEIRKEQQGAIQATLDQIEKGEISAWKGKKTVLGKIQNLRMASNTPWAIDFAEPLKEDTSKIEKIVEICRKSLEEQRKVIVFTSFIKTGGRITKALQEAGIGVVRVYADDENANPKKMTPAMRDEQIELFQESSVEEVTVLVANLSLISEGLTLTEASVIINHDHAWRSLLRAQGISRVVRPGGRMEGVDVYELVHEFTVDQYIWDMVKAKDAANKALIDRDMSELNSESDLDEMYVAQQLVQDLSHV